MIEITIKGPLQSGRTTRAAQIANALVDAGMMVSFTYPTPFLADRASKMVGLRCSSSRKTAGGPFLCDAVVVDDSEMHDPEALNVIRHRLELRPHSVLVLVTLQGE